MEMNDILNGLNSCDDGCSDSTSNNSCGCGGNISSQGFGGGCGGFGGGFSSWIWILLILFYSGCGSNGFGGGYGNSGGNNCCCEKKQDNCCCNNTGSGTGLLGNCSAYLFLLVILFLCNGWGSFGGGFGGQGLGGFTSNCGC